MFRTTSNFLCNGIGGFKRRGEFKFDVPKLPDTKPDFEVEEKTEVNQAYYYRLCADSNPLHVDPEISKMGGFDVPILHGLCTYGITAKALYEAYHKEDPNLMKKLTMRFTSHVYPGETLVI